MNHLFFVFVCISSFSSLGAAVSKQLEACPVYDESGIGRTSMLQLSASEHQPSASSLGNGHAHMVGRGVDATTGDLWDLRKFEYVPLFSGAPEDCVHSISCPQADVREVRDFTSTSEFTKNYYSEFGISVDAAWKGIAGNFSAGLNYSSEHRRSSDLKSTYFKASKHRKCTRFETTCAMNVEYLAPEVRRILVELHNEDRKDNPPDDAVSMERWHRRFVQPFGSHVVTSVAHGGTIQALDIVDKACEATLSCRKAHAAFKLGIAKLIQGKDENIDLDYLSKSCSGVPDCVTDSKTKCVTLGGTGDDPALCDKDVSEEAVSSFLNGGDMTDASTVVSMTMKPMDIVLASLPGYGEQSKQVMQAVEWAGCNLPFGEWTLDASRGKHYCKCALDCKNGGTLSELSCSCDCSPIQNPEGGFNGYDCSNQYGNPGR